jgi:hypothetical protein
LDEPKFESLPALDNATLLGKTLNTAFLDTEAAGLHRTPFVVCWNVNYI